MSVSVACGGLWLAQSGAFSSYACAYVSFAWLRARVTHTRATHDVSQHTQDTSSHKPAPAAQTSQITKGKAAPRRARCHVVHVACSHKRLLLYLSLSFFMLFSFFFFYS